MSTLFDLKIGDRAKVVGYTKGSRDYRQRLLAVGLIPGAEFSLTRMAPLGDPIELSLQGCSISLRKHEGSVLNIENITTTPAKDLACR